LSSIGRKFIHSALALPVIKLLDPVCPAFAVLRLFVMIKESKTVPLHKFVALSKFQIFAHHLAYKLAE
jgi:hypothetical protein